MKKTTDEKKTRIMKKNPNILLALFFTARLFGKIY